MIININLTFQEEFFMSLSIDTENGPERLLEEMVGPTKTAMVYGFYHCYYDRLYFELSNKEYKVYDYSLSEFLQVPKGFCIFPNFIENNTVPKECQASLALFVIENYRKKLCGVKKLPPILFCIDTNNNCYTRINLSNVQEYKILKKRSLVTVKELRRAYKLCHDPFVDPRIRDVARRTFIFLKVVTNSRGRIIELRKVPPPWKKAIKFNSAVAKKAKDPNNWRFQANAAAYLLNGKYIAPSTRPRRRSDLA